MSQIVPKTNDQQRAFAAAYALGETAGNGTQSAIAANYAADCAAVTANRLLRHPGVRFEIEKLTREALGDHATFAVKFLGRVVRDENAALKLRIDAANSILSRAGFVPTKAPEAPDLTEKETAELSMAELQAAIRKIDAEIERARSEIIDVTPEPAPSAPLTLAPPSAS